MIPDPSNGWEAVAGQLIQGRRQSRIGERTIRTWAATLSPGASILDLGCGSGVPVSTTLAELGLRASYMDEGGNNYYDALKPASPAAV